MRRALLVLALLALWAAPAQAMKLNLLQGQTCANSAPRPCLVGIFIQDSSSTVGAGLTGLTSGSAGLVCYYTRSDQGNAGATQHTLGAATRGTWSATSNFVEKDSANCPGCYELSLTTSMLAANSTWVQVMCKGATNMAPMLLEIALVNYDPQNATTLGLTNLDAAVSSRMATFTLPTNFSAFSLDGSGRVDLAKWVGVAPNALIAGRVDSNAQVVGDKSGYSLTVTPPTAATIATTLWQDLTAGADFGTAGSIGALLKADVDAAISSRSTYAGADTAGTTTLLTRLPSAITLAAGAVTVGTNNDKTGYSLTQAFPTNFSALSIDANGRAKIQAWVQKNTALAGVSFQMTDSTTNLPKTGLAPSCTRNLDGGAFGAGTLANITEIASGYYKLDYGAGDLNGGNIITLCTAAGANDIGWTLGTYP